MIQLSNVTSVESTSIFRDHVAQLGHIVHAAEDASIGRLRERDTLVLKLSEGVDRKLFGAQLALYEVDDEPVDVSDVHDRYVWGESGEKGTSMRDENAFAPVDPQYIRVPIIVISVLCG